MADSDSVLDWRISVGRQMFEPALWPTRVCLLNAYPARCGHRLMLPASDQNEVYIIHTLYPRYEVLQFDTPRAVPGSRP